VALKLLSSNLYREEKALSIIGPKEGDSLKTKVQPIGGNVLVRRVEQKKKGPIIIPDTAKEKPKQGKVVALGTGVRDEDGKKKSFSVKVGDLVLFESYGGTDITIDDEEYVIMSEDSILGIVKKK